MGPTVAAIASPRPLMDTPPDAESLLPMGLEGWVVLGLALLVTFVWLIYVYR